MRYYTLWATLTALFGHCLCVTMCNFIIIYHTEIGICRKPNQIVTKNATEKRQMCELIALLSLTQINAGNF